MPNKRAEASQHVPALVLLAALSVLWTWPLALNWSDHIPGRGGDNYSFLWNLWWMRKALSSPDLDFFHSTYLFSPFGVDLVNHPHTALQGLISATALGSMSIIEAQNAYIIASMFLNALCAYALAFDIVGNRRAALVAAVAFGGSPYIAAHLLGHFDLLTAWVIPLFALCLRRSLRTGAIGSAVGAGLCVGVAAYAAYYHVVYLAVFAVTYVVASWDALRVGREPRAQTQALFTIRLILMALMALDVFLLIVIAMFGGFQIDIGGAAISARTIQNPLLLLWLLVFAWLLTKWRVACRFERPSAEAFWPGAQTLMIVIATFSLVCLPLIAQAFRIILSGRYVSQTYFWRSAPRGVDALAPIAGHPFHPLYGDVVSGFYSQFGLDRIEAVGWIGVVPIVVLLTRRGQWADDEEVRRWKGVLLVFAIWALGPFLTIGGVDVGLPFPQALARFVPIVDNARMPGRAMVCVYLALGVLMALRLAAVGTVKAGLKASTTREPALLEWVVLLLLTLDYLHAPIPLTALHRPAVYEQLATIDDGGAVIEVPFGIGDGLSSGRGSQERRLLYHATIHGHPVVGGYIGRMPPLVAQAYEAMPVIGNLLRLSNGEEAIEEEAAMPLPFRYLVLDTTAASPELSEYVHRALDIDLISSGDGRQLYAVQGMRPANIRASR